MKRLALAKCKDLDNRVRGEEDEEIGSDQPLFIGHVSNKASIEIQ
jgi:hypothetical protein